MRINIVETERHPAAGHVADAEIVFTDGIMAGAKLVGFGIWEKRSGAGLNVTMPARQYSVNGERRSFALLRPAIDADALDRVKATIVDAYMAHMRPSRQTAAAVAAAPEPVQHADGWSGADDVPAYTETVTVDTTAPAPMPAAAVPVTGPGSDAFYRVVTPAAAPHAARPASSPAPVVVPSSSSRPAAPVAIDW